MTFSVGTGLGGFPGCQKRFVQGAPLPARDVIAFVVGNQIDNRTLGQGSRLVEDGPPLLDTCSESAHMATVRDSKVLGKRSRARRAGAGELFFRPPITLVENRLMEFCGAHQISEHGVEVARGRLEVRMDQTLARRYRAPQNRRLANHRLREREALFTFLSYPGLEATNWRVVDAPFE